MKERFSQPDVAINILQNIHDGQTHVGEFLSLIFNGLPISVAWKNQNSVWEGANEYMTKQFNLKYPEDTIGKTDFDLCLKKEEADLYIKEDQEVVRTGQSKCCVVHPFHKTNGSFSMIYKTKIPIYDKSRKTINSIVCFFTDLPTATNHGLINEPHTPFDHFCQSLKNNNSYYILIEDQPRRLTTRQAECLALLSTGKTVKEIAAITECEPYTIQNCLNYLKQKLQAPSTSTLIKRFWDNPIRWF